MVVSSGLHPTKPHPHSKTTSRVLGALLKLGAAVLGEGEAHVRPAVLPRALPLSGSCVVPTHIVLVTQDIWTGVQAPHPLTATPRPAWNSGLPGPLCRCNLPRWAISEAEHPPSRAWDSVWKELRALGSATPPLVSPGRGWPELSSAKIDPELGVGAGSSGRADVWSEDHETEPPH